MTERASERKLLLHVFPSFAAGGAQIRFVNIAKQLGRDFRHAVIAMDGDCSCQVRLAPELAVFFPPFEPPAGGLLNRLSSARAALRHLRPDVLITSNWGAIEWAIANMIPLVRHIHTEDGFGVEERNRQLKRRVATRRLALRRSTVVVPSRTLFEIAREIWRIPPTRLCYIPNGVDLARFTPASPRRHGDPMVIGCVAALRPEKNVARLLHAMHGLAAAHRVRLIVAGDGPERVALRGLAMDLGLEVEFLGEVEDPAPLYRQFDAFALASETEQMPLSVLEAMASGLVVVATDVGDIRAMVAAENRPLVLGHDDVALMKSLATLIEAPERRHEIGAANRRRAELEFDQQLMFRGYRALWNGVQEGTGMT
ncbi:MAG: glycosyltransferase family 4 protein [Acetobacteraceae bacterium]